MTANNEADFRTALSSRRLVLDGGLSTELERRGSDVSGRLWSAQLLADDPAAIRRGHAAFLAAGADVITTASYQASTEGLNRAGFAMPEAQALLQRSVALAREACAATQTATGRPAWVAGSIGPYGAMLANGSEYTGDYGPDVDIARLRAFHRPRLEILALAGVDVLAVETVPSLAEAEALALEVAALDVPSWLSLTTVTDPDGTVRTRLGEPAAEAFALAADIPAVIAVGINCTDPAGLAQAISVAAASCGKPVVAYPNSGEGWNAAVRSWTGTANGFSTTDVDAWLTAGARLVGGCCRVSPAMITQLSGQILQESPPADRPAAPQY